MGEFFLFLVTVLECIYLVICIIEKCITLNEWYREKKNKRKTPSNATKQTDGVGSDNSES
jgi:hypothetical protein